MEQQYTICRMQISFPSLQDTPTHTTAAVSPTLALPRNFCTILFCTQLRFLFYLSCALASVLLTEANAQERSMQNSPPFVFNKEGNWKNIPTQAKTDSNEFPGVWGPTIRLTQEEGYIPSIATQESNYVFISWSIDSPAGKLRLARSTNFGETFEIKDFSDSVRFPRGIAASKVVADRKYIYLFFIPYNSNGIGYAPAYVMRSYDHGVTFDSAYQITDINLASGNRHSAAVNGDTVVFVQIVDSYTNNIVVSKNGGKAWKKVKTFKERKTEILWSRNIAISEKALHMVFMRASRKYPGGETFYRRSTNLGKSWKSERLLTDRDGNSSFDAVISASQKGELYVAWREAKYGSYNGSGGSFALRKSMDDGKSWLSEEILTQIPEAVLDRQPISVDRYKNNIVSATWLSDTTEWSSDDSVITIKSRISTNGGISWLPEKTLSSDTLWSVYSNTCVSPNVVVVAWEDGGLASVSDGFRIFARVARINPLKEQQNTITSVPAQPAQLLQNYPNPFNPETNIAFTLRSTSLVTLKIYDVLGREVATLLNNEKKNEGNYAMKFDASQLPSGTYFSRLFAETIYEDRYAEVRKIVIVR